jgi:hypothetical protein
LDRAADGCMEARMIRIFLCAAVLFGFALTLASDVFAQPSESELAKQTQNPVASLISVPFQANTTIASVRASGPRTS